MDFKIYLVFLLLLNILRTLQADEFIFSSNPDEHWENFKRIFQKDYLEEEELMRRSIFEVNLKKIIEHNRRYDQGLHSFRMSCNAFADMMISEIRDIFNGLIPGESNEPIPFTYDLNANVPESIDWRERGAVTPVKEQGTCGSCYAFSATGALEGQHFLKSKELVSLSEQNIIDCSREQGNEGCNGGSMDAAFDYVKVNEGLDSEKSYPYINKKGTCDYNPENSTVTCQGYSDIPQNEATLKIAVGLKGPISVGIDASHESFQLYKSGIYDEPNCSSTELDHGVLVVGYGSENGTDYWTVKNSWGPRWGENGYIRMSRNKGNQCGIATMASYPLI